MTTLAPQLAGRLEVVPYGEPACLISPDGSACLAPGLEMPADGELVELYRRLVAARRFDRQATTLTRQGRLAVYPSAGGQEACQVGAVLALGAHDWMFPTYRETVALVTRGIPAAEALSLLRGDWHCGYDPVTVSYTHLHTRRQTWCVSRSSDGRRFRPPLRMIGIARRRSGITRRGDSS